MTKREKFIEEIWNHATSDGGIRLSEDAFAYLKEMRNGKVDSEKMVTEAGMKVLQWIKDNTNIKSGLEYFSSITIGEALFCSSRAVTGAARKLVQDGYLVKEGKNPVTYKITQAGAQICSESH
jgi:hypothetical protein